MSDLNLIFDTKSSESDINKNITIELSTGVTIKLPFNTFDDLKASSLELISRLERIVSVIEL